MPSHDNPFGKKAKKKKEANKALQKAFEQSNRKNLQWLIDKLRKK